MGPHAASKPMTLSEQADELEEQMMHDLNAKIATKSVLFNLADGRVDMESGAALMAKNPGKYFLMGADPRLPKMPDKPQLIDFFKQRFASMNHLLQSATHALKAGLDEKVVLACLLHDIGVVSFIRCDHGYWGAQLIEPYVDEEVSWAVRVHQALRFFPDKFRRLRLSRPLPQIFRPGLPARALHRRGIRARPQTQILHDRAAHLRERHLLVRPERQGRSRRFRRHHRAQFQAAEGGARFRQHALLAHVAHADVADAVLVTRAASLYCCRPRVCAGTTAKRFRASYEIPSHSVPARPACRTTSPQRVISPLMKRCNSSGEEVPPGIIPSLTIRC